MGFEGFIPDIVLSQFCQDMINGHNMLLSEKTWIIFIKLECAVLGVVRRSQIHDKVYVSLFNGLFLFLLSWHT